MAARSRIGTAPRWTPRRRYQSISNTISAGSYIARAGPAYWDRVADCLHVGSEDGPIQENWVDGSDLIFDGTPGTVTITQPLQVGLDDLPQQRLGD